MEEQKTKAKKMTKKMTKKRIARNEREKIGVWQFCLGDVGSFPLGVF